MTLPNFFANANFDSKCNNLSICASEWSPFIAYYANNIVTIGGSVWICARDSVNNKPHVGSPYWTLLCLSCAVTCKPAPCPVPCYKPCCYRGPPRCPVPCYKPCCYKPSSCPVPCYRPCCYKPSPCPQPCYKPCCYTYPVLEAPKLYEYVVREENPYSKRCDCETRYKNCTYRKCSC